VGIKPGQGQAQSLLYMGIHVETMEGESQDKGASVWWHRILSWKWSTRLNKRSKSYIVGVRPCGRPQEEQMGRDAGEVGRV
jgi:hypothetical protein